MKNPLRVLIAAGLIWSAAAVSHHNPASHYLLDKTITVKGVVTKWQLINPHARIYFDVKTPDGKVEAWMAEGNAAGILKRRGFTKDTLKAGDAITITGSPSRDGKNMLDWTLITLADGTELRGGNTVAGENERQLDDIEKRRRQAQEKPSP
jgi:hypothetical protein